jgi:predicted nucleotidyltransferase
MDCRLKLTESEHAALRAFVDWVRGRFGTRLREIALFGSRARGEGHEESDLDVLVVIDDLTSREAREIAHQCGDVLTEHDVLISPFAVASARFALLRNRERRIAREIDRDAVAL